MLVSYTGWGYFEYEVDTDAISYTSEEISQGLKRLHSGTSGCYLRVENIIFELPIPAQRDFSVLGKTTVEYLLFSEFTFFDEVDLRFNLPPKDDGRFWLCEDKPIYDDFGQVVHCERKKVMYKLEDVTRPEDVLKAKDQTESLNLIGSIPDQQAVDVKNVSAQKKAGTKKTRRQEQIPLLLSIIEQLQHDRLKIPVGEKQTILQKCLENKLFTTKYVFNKAWSELSVSGQIAIANKQKFLKIQ